MSSRKGWQGTVKIPTSPPTESPNKQEDYVSAHIRVYWPHTATKEQVFEAIDAAWCEAMISVRETIQKNQRKETQ